MSCNRRSGLLFSIAQRRWVVIGGIGLFSFLFLVQGALRHWPLPSNMDEFSTVLGADTFAHGRLTNPTPALWEHFETLHVIFTPTYASKYPAAPALMLACGERVFGNLIWGVWLSTALACAALTWMLLAWVPVRWALIGGFLAALHPLIVSWGRFYLCCNLGVLGGALILGSAKRLLRRSSYRHSALFGIGIALLLNVRPYEGTVLSIGVAIWLFFALVRPQPNSMRMLLPMAIPVLLITVAWMGYYNWRVTGSLWKLPYAVHAAQYDSAPTFWFLKPRPRWEYRHQNIANFHEWELSTYLDLQDTSLRWRILGRRLIVLTLWLFDVGMFALLWGWRLIRQRSTLPVLAMAGLMVMAFLLPTWMNSNYISCAVPLYFIVLTQCLRRMGRFVLPCTQLLIGPVLISVMLLVTFAWALQDLQPFELNDSNYGYARAEIIRQLHAEGGRHVIFVRYSPPHARAEEWIYNDANIASAPIIWAHDEGDVGNRELMALYPGRQAWLLQPDRQPVQLAHLLLNR